MTGSKINDKLKIQESLPLTDKWGINGRVESLPLTNTRDTNGWVESQVLHMIVKDFFIATDEHLRLFIMRIRGFYTLKESFFDVMKDPYLKQNKDGRRPHYYCVEDELEGVCWMIPMSSRIDKYESIIKKRIEEGKPCDILHIVRLDSGNCSVFLIQDIFPVTAEYIEREYLIGENHLVLTSEKSALEVEQKAKKVLSLIKRGIKLMPTQPDVMHMLEVLLQNHKTR